MGIVLGLSKWCGRTSASNFQPCTVCGSVDDSQSGVNKVKCGATRKVAPLFFWGVYRERDLMKNADFRKWQAALGATLSVLLAFTLAWASPMGGGFSQAAALGGCHR